jgi:hypothetical protein
MGVVGYFGVGVADLTNRAVPSINAAMIFIIAAVQSSVSFPTINGPACGARTARFLTWSTLSRAKDAAVTAGLRALNVQETSSSGPPVEFAPDHHAGRA